MYRIYALILVVKGDLEGSSTRIEFAYVIRLTSTFYVFKTPNNLLYSIRDL